MYSSWLRIDKPFWCYGYVKFINPEVIALLEHAGCNEINIGVQAVRQDTRRIIKRGDTNENIARALKELRESSIFVSTGKAINPVTNTNWEGVGVKPDVEVEAERALDKAPALAKQAAKEYRQSK